MSNQTSLITILSSDHGRLRREQRDISKRDLQKAKKYGTVERCWGQRYKIMYDGIVFITNSTQSREVTCFPAPMDLAPLDAKTNGDHAKALQIISKKPEHCASHTVFVMDVSGSMKTHDIPLHRDRQVAAFTNVALEYVAEQLFSETANNRDVVSLVEFNNSAKVVFEREPVSWVLFNKLLQRRGLETIYKCRESSRVFDGCCSDSNYLPALDAASKLLARGFHEDCALSLLFVSDGLPTDAGMHGLTPAASQRDMNKKVCDLSAKYIDQLNISFVGFGSALMDFSSLEAMAEAANEAAGVKLASFFYCDKLADHIGNAASSLSSSTMVTKTALANGEGRLTNKNRRSDIVSEADAGSNSWNFFKILNQYVYNPQLDDWVPFGKLPPGALRVENFKEATNRFQHHQLPEYLAMNKGYCGTGVERVAYRCSLADETNSKSFQFGKMVAKETLRVDRIEELVAFHKLFCETQSLAAHLADQFNKKLRGLPHFCEETTPRVSFLKCSVLLLADPKWPGGKRGVLVEKELNTNRFEWKKWNNNGGGVEGKITHRPMDVDFELEQLERETLAGNSDMMIMEEDSEDEDSDDDSESEASDEMEPTARNDVPADPYAPSDYLQAFSHFTYLFTNKKLLVCDLQGIYNEDTRTFELSDPAIHYRSSKGSGKRMVYGRTDKGQAGVQLFFNSHDCTGICKILELSTKKNHWKKEWRRNFDEDMRKNFSV